MAFLFVVVLVLGVIVLATDAFLFDGSFAEICLNFLLALLFRVAFYVTAWAAYQRFKRKSVMYRGQTFKFYREEILEKAEK